VHDEVASFSRVRRRLVRAYIRNAAARYGDSINEVRIARLTVIYNPDQEPIALGHVGWEVPFVLRNPATDQGPVAVHAKAGHFTPKVERRKPCRGVLSLYKELSRRIFAGWSALGVDMKDGPLDGCSRAPHEIIIRAITFAMGGAGYSNPYASYEYQGQKQCQS